MSSLKPTLTNIIVGKIFPEPSKLFTCNWEKKNVLPLKNYLRHKDDIFVEWISRFQDMTNDPY